MLQNKRGQSEEKYWNSIINFGWPESVSSETKNGFLLNGLLPVSCSMIKRHIYAEN